jgi:ribosomal protein S18 acetylase RimI-like enzyme
VSIQTLEFIAAENSAQLWEIHNLAPVLWNYAYKDILSSEQIKYMLEWMYSIETLEKSLDNDTKFFLIEINGVNQGFIALSGDSDNSSLVMLDKLYLHKDYHGLGIGQDALNFACLYAEKNGFKQIQLHVNKNNHRAQKAYCRNGFVISSAVVTDIGNNFVMDDYVMTKNLLNF